MKKQITLLTFALLGIISTTTAQQQGKKTNLNETRWLSGAETRWLSGAETTMSILTNIL